MQTDVDGQTYDYLYLHLLLSSHLTDANEHQIFHFHQFCCSSVDKNQPCCYGDVQ
jgi:hypothetical protein